ncbi:hypothetical protein F5X68DRAFT_22433 [Plectosphaerella plurivora]|uniref:Uncharacterized protein n=1 Tax=Plectosphaerella plurivora TaxID=936078 RepID=A0A9P9A9W4_9PEZI|nr:hypothetical protein F5X68DRAFT_22433 [Plectosphaerella plurivora]
MSDDADPNWFRKALEWPTSDYTTRCPSRRRHSSVHERDPEDVWKYFTQRQGYIPPSVLSNEPPGAIPPKPSDAGSFEHVMYIPEWTDPNYIPPKHMPDSVTTLRQTLRPAQLATDAIKNPTPFAKRFGIYPWGTDGRSLLTPTREYNVTVPTAMPGSTADELADDGDGASTATRTMPASTLVKESMDLARAEGKTLDDLLDELERTLPDLPDDQRATARAMLNMRVAQDWQSILLGDLTSDEWVGDKIFEISDEVYGTPGNNTIHDLFQRWRWCTKDFILGEANDLPRCMYNVNGRRGEWNPFADDWLWDRMQPLLRHLSRLWEYLIENDPYWTALLDPFNRVRISESRDPRNKMSKMKCPLTTFGNRPNKHMSGRHPLAEKLSAHIDGAFETLELLYRSVEFEVTSANHFEGDKPGPDASYGSSHVEPDDDPEAVFPFKIIINLAVDYMYPLLHDGYSESEKMMAIHSITMTVLHELAHSINYVHFSWLRSPGPEATMPRRNKRGLKKLAVYGRWLFGPVGEGFKHEPFYEDEDMHEAGFSMENAVFGGFLWGVTEWAGDSWNHIAAMPSGIRLRPWPAPGCSEPVYYDPDDSAPCETSHIELNSDRRPMNTFQMLVPWPSAAKLQTDEFWSVQVQKFGNAALRLAPDPNTKAWNKTKVHDIDYLLTDGGKDLAFTEVLGMDLPKNSQLVGLFLKMQVTELKRVSSLQRRWEAEIGHLTHHMRKAGAIHCLLRLYLQAVVWHRDWMSSRTGTLRWTSVYREYRDLMRTFRKIVGAPRPEHDTSARPRWLPPLLSKKIKSAEALRDTPAELQQEGSAQLLPLAMEAVHMVNEVIVRAESFLAELWTLSDDHRKMVLGKDFRGKMQELFRGALGKCNEVVETARVPAEVDPTSSDFLAQALATAAKIKRLRPIFKNLRRVPNNALDMLTCVPNLNKSRRLASERWLRTARSELLCLSSEDQECAEEVLEWLRTHHAHRTAMQVPKPGVAGKVNEWQKLMSDWEGGGLGVKSKPTPGSSQSQGDDDGDDDGSEKDVFGFFLKRRRGKGGRHKTQKQKTAGESRATRSEASKKRHRGEGEDLPEAKKQNKPGERAELKAGAWRAPKPAGGRASDSGWHTGGLKLLSPKQLGLRNPRLSHSSAFTDGTFSDRSSDSPFRGLSPMQGPEPGQPWQAPGSETAGSETVPVVQPMFGPSAMDVPATIGMFPHPYALNATTTTDLALVPPAAGKNSKGLRDGGDYWNKFRDDNLGDVEDDGRDEKDGRDEDDGDDTDDGDDGGDEDGENDDGLNDDLDVDLDDDDLDDELSDEIYDDYTGEFTEEMDDALAEELHKVWQEENDALLSDGSIYLDSTDWSTDEEYDEYY